MHINRKHMHRVRRQQKKPKLENKDRLTQCLSTVLAFQLPSISFVVFQFCMTLAQTCLARFVHDAMTFSYLTVRGFENSVQPSKVCVWAFPPPKACNVCKRLKGFFLCHNQGGGGNAYFRKGLLCPKWWLTMVTMQNWMAIKKNTI